MSTTPEVRRIFKAFVMNPSAESAINRYSPGYLVISGNRIESLSENDPRREFPDAQFIELDGKTIVPGFVDAHVHLPQYAIMGKGSGELLSWLTNWTYPEEARFSDGAYAARIADMFFDEMIANGTTTAAIYSSVHEQATDIAFRTAQAKGFRAFIGKVMMDRNSPPQLQETTAESIAASVRLFEKWDGADGGRLRYIFTPRFAGSCSMDLMKQVGRLAKDCHAFVQSHLSENKEEVAMIAKLFPEASSYAGVYDSAGLLHERSLMGHCIHLSDDEMETLAATGANAVFCPCSNRMLRSGPMPYDKLRRTGIHIALGTDVAGGPSLSMIRQMHEARDTVGLSADEALYLATLAGAKALGVAGEIGSLDPGKEADFAVLDKDTVSEVYVRGSRVYFKKP
jgi:guanine deaminase